MCGIFGFTAYGEPLKDVNNLVSSLARQSAVRGTDATGVAYMNRGKLEIKKAAKSAYEFNINLSRQVKAVIGHTRHATQGSEKLNINNHPFLGRLKNNLYFALAHNGVLSNDKSLRKSLSLPKTKVETDSFVAVQLLEQKGDLSMESIKYMAEKVSGSFSFNLLDEHNNHCLVKGDSPISMLHFAKSKVYVYASTDEILWKALINTELFQQLKNGAFEEIVLNEGQILKIYPNGKLEYADFKYSDCYSSYNWWNYGRKTNTSNQYLDDLKQVANSMGYDDKHINELFECGYTCEEIEEMLYEAGYEFCEY